MNGQYLYKRNIRINYIFTYLMSMNITHGFWMIYLASKGMSLVQLGIVEGIFHVTSFIMETPTGAIADIFGRKTSRLIGRFLNMGYILIMLFGNSFIHFIIAFIICGISYNLESGAGEALVYDSLLEIKQEDKYMKVNGLIEVCYQIAQATSLVIGGFIAIRSYESLFSIQVVVIILTIIVGLFFKETTIGREKIEEKISVTGTIKRQYVDSFKIINGNTKLFYLIIFLNVLNSFTTTSFFYIQIYFKTNGINESLMGFFLAISCALGALGGITAHSMEKKIKEKRILMYLPVVFSLILWGLVTFKTSIIAFMILGILDSSLFVVFSDYINKLIPSDKRATLLSFSSMVYSFAMIIGFPIFGAIAEHFTLERAFMILAATASVLAMINVIIHKKVNA